jgi:hypothetical protein
MLKKIEGSEVSSAVYTTEKNAQTAELSTRQQNKTRVLSIHKKSDRVLSLRPCVTVRVSDNFLF